MNQTELRLERLAWPDVQQAMAHGMTTAVVACGSVEQHGPHLPLFMDAEHGERLAVEIARRLGDALVAPAIRVGCSEHHMAFPGTVSLSAETFENLCRDYVTSLRRHGFRRICFFSSHGGNFRPLADMLGRLDDAAGRDAHVLAHTDLLAVIETMRTAVEEASGLGDRVGGHADIAESSIMLMLHPELVKQEAAAEGYTGELTPDLVDKIFREGLDAVAPNGILGDARGMSATIGERCVDRLADMLAAHFSTVTV